jgi:hypothetical protein
VLCSTAAAQGSPAEGESEDQRPAASAAPQPDAVPAATAKPASGPGTKAAKPKTAAKPRPAGGAPFGPSSGDAHRAYKDSVLDKLWPVDGPAPLPGSILPHKRVIAFYGNPLSRRMGVLGEFEPDEMLRRLDVEVDEWQRLDPATPVQPALHLIAVVAQAGPGSDRKYRARMDSAMIEKVYGWAQRRKAILFLDVQVGHSTLQQELPALARFLKRPDVHLGIDPEFSIKDGRTPPGKKIGSFSAADLNYASRFLAGLVDEHKLPPKILVVHRFTKKGVTDYRDIRLDPRVQIVMHMDGFGAPWLKRDSFYSYIKKEPVQFVGWKQFSKRRNDNPPTPKKDILRLNPVPLYIQYQ